MICISLTIVPNQEKCRSVEPSMCPSSLVNVFTNMFGLIILAKVSMFGTCAPESMVSCDLHKQLSQTWTTFAWLRRVFIRGTVYKLNRWDHGAASLTEKVMFSWQRA